MCGYFTKKLRAVKVKVTLIIIKIFNMEKNTNPIKHYQKIEILNFSYNTLISLSIIVYGFMVTFSEVKDKQNANLVIGIFIGSLLGRLINTQLGIGKTDGSKPVINNSDTKSST